ncbi:MAG: SlyX family protein [Candidatus Malihini olakiniferum]
MPHSHLEQRIEIIENKLAFQEMTIDELNQIIIQHELKVSKIREHLYLLAEKIKTFSPSLFASHFEELPPHF